MFEQFCLSRLVNWLNDTEHSAVKTFFLHVAFKNFYKHDIWPISHSYSICIIINPLPFAMFNVLIDRIYEISWKLGRNFKHSRAPNVIKRNDIFFGIIQFDWTRHIFSRAFVFLNLKRLDNEVCSEDSLRKSSLALGISLVCSVQ